MPDDEAARYALLNIEAGVRGAWDGEGFLGWRNVWTAALQDGEWGWIEAR